MARPNKNAPLGQGGRFAALKNTLANRPGVTNPGALAAYIGRKKYGKARFQSLSAAGRKSLHGSGVFNNTDMRQGHRKLETCPMGMGRTMVNPKK